MTATRLLILCILALVAAPLRTHPAEAAAEFSVFDAATQPVGARIRITGGFHSLYGSGNYLSLSSISPVICSHGSGGTVFAKLRLGWFSFTSSEGEKLKHIRSRSAEPVTIEGTIGEIKDGRFIHMKDTVVIR